MRRGISALLGACMGALGNSCISFPAHPHSEIASPAHSLPQDSHSAPSPNQTSLELRCKVSPEQMKGVQFCQEDAFTEEADTVTKLANYSFCELQQAIQNPAQAAFYCERLLSHGGITIDKDRFGKDWWMSGEQTHANRKCDCDDAAVAAASLLKDDGYPPYVLVIRGLEKKAFMIPPGKTGVVEVPFAHALFLYKTEEGKFGSLGINRFDRRQPNADSIDVFLNGLSIDMKCEINEWVIYDLGRVHPDYDTNSFNNSPEQERE